MAWSTRSISLSCWAVGGRADEIGNPGRPDLDRSGIEIVDRLESQVLENEWMSVARAPGEHTKTRAALRGALIDLPSVLAVRQPCQARVAGRTF